MATINLTDVNIGSALVEIMEASEIEPGSVPSYQVCKTLFMYHPLGSKLAAMPVAMAMADQRDIAITESPGEHCLNAFRDQWEADNADAYIFQTVTMSRVYGVSTLALMIAGKQTTDAVDWFDLPELDVSLNVYDPLNTSGSLVLNQDPLAMDFMKHGEISVQGARFHRSRAVTLYHEMPVYLGWSNSAFGFVGRSVYQRILFMMKSYLKSIITDDMIETKVGVLVAKLKQPGSIANAIMSAAAAFKRNVLKEAETGNVINVTVEESIESLNLQNLDGPHVVARKNILENIASGADMPSKIMTNESFVEGFGEGDNDAKVTAQFLDKLRRDIAPIYRFMDRFVMHRAWTPAFFKTMQKKFPEQYGDMGYTEAFYQWSNSFTAIWPPVIKEPESERVQLDDVKLKSAIAIFQVLEPMLDVQNKMELMRWFTDAISSNKTMFTSPLVFDEELLTAELEEREDMQKEMAEQGAGGGMGESLMGGGEGEGEQEGTQSSAMGANEPGGGQVKVKMGKSDSARADATRRNNIERYLRGTPSKLVNLDDLKRILRS